MSDGGLALLGWSEGVEGLGSVVLRLGMDWADAKRHIARKIAIGIAIRHEGTAPVCFLCRVLLAFSFIEKISKHPFNFIMGRKASYVHFICGGFPSLINGELIGNRPTATKDSKPQRPVLILVKYVLDGLGLQGRHFVHAGQALPEPTFSTVQGPVKRTTSARGNRPPLVGS
jgi:hypothetical protein